MQIKILKSRLPLLLLGTILIVVVSIGSYIAVTLILPHAQTIAINDVPPPDAQHKQYINQVLKYGFNYPRDAKLFECKYIPCLYASHYSLRVEPFEPYFFTKTNSRSSFLENDFFCAADGPSGSTKCRNTKVEDFTNTLGVQGYKVYRVKTISSSGSGIKPGTYDDIVYVFPLSSKIKRGDFNFSGIMFAVDYPSQTNLMELNNTVNSLFLLK